MVEQAASTTLETGSDARETAEATRGSAVKLSAEAGGRLFALATTLLLARSLGVADFGLFAALSGVAAVLAESADLGLRPLASQALVAGTASLASMVRARLVLAGVMLVVLAACFVFSPLLGVLAAYYSLVGWGEFLGVALRARGRRGDEAVTILVLRTGSLVAASLAWLGGGGPLAFGSALALAATAPVGFAAWRLGLPAAQERPAPAAPVTALLRSALPLGLNGWLALLGLRLELLVLALARPPEEAGAYAAALRVVEALLLVPAAVCAGAMPALTREAVRGAGPVRDRTATTVALLAVPAALGVFLVAPGLVGTLFGAEFGAAVPALRILGLSLVVVFMNGVLLHALLAAGRHSRLPALTAVRVVAAGLAALVAVPAFGPAGGAAGFLAAEALLFLLGAHACASAGFPVPLLRPLGLGLAASLPMAGAVLLSRGGPLASMALGVLTYAATLLAAGFVLRRWRIDVRYS